MDNNIMQSLQTLHKDVVELKAENKYILQILERMAVTQEKVIEVNESVISLNEKVSSFSSRITALETLYNRLQVEMASTCPSHRQYTEQNSKHLMELEEELVKLSDDTKEEFRYRDRIMVSLVVAIILQVVGVIFYIVFQKGL
jgi:hypothetical protein